MSTTFKITDFTAYQKLAMQKIVVEKLDILVSLPTGSRKPLIYQALVVVFNGG